MAEAGMSNEDKKATRALRRVDSQPSMDEATFMRLVDEGQSLRREVERRAAPSRVVTPDDMKTRSR